MTKEEYKTWRDSVDFVKELYSKYDENGNYEQGNLFKQRDTGKLFIAEFYNGHAVDKWNNRGIVKGELGDPLEVTEQKRTIEETYYIDKEGFEVYL